jgi:hypothetical protein
MDSETLQQLSARLAREMREACRASPFSSLWQDYSSRFSRDLRIWPAGDEAALEADWAIIPPVDMTRRLEL